MTADEQILAPPQSPQQRPLVPCWLEVRRSSTTHQKTPETCSIFIDLNKTARCNQKYNKHSWVTPSTPENNASKHFNYCTISGDCTLYWRKGTVAACETSCPFQNPSMISSRMQCACSAQSEFKGCKCNTFTRCNQTVRILSIYPFNFTMISLRYRYVTKCLLGSLLKTARRP